jgi:hypothetical protein
MTLQPPYRRTVHTWTLTNSEIVVDDLGWPQRPGVREAVLRGWRSGGAYSVHERDGVVEPVVTAPVPPEEMVAIDSFKRFGREFAAIPRTRDGSIEARALAGAKRGRA